eukprot:2256137-Pyramimonas_sp.AAC.1
MIRMINEIYAARKFVGRGGGVKYSQRPQDAEIAQGCPLSPYLFVIVMPVLPQAMSKKLNPINQSTPKKLYLITRDILYADDALL